MFFMMIMSILVSLGSHSPAILNTQAKYTRLDLCSRDYDDNNTHNPESLKKRGRGNGSETQPKIESPKTGKCSPKPPSSRENPRPSGRGWSEKLISPAFGDVLDDDIFKLKNNINHLLDRLVFVLFCQTHPQLPHSSFSLPLLSLLLVFQSR